MSDVICVQPISSASAFPILRILVQNDTRHTRKPPSYPRKRVSRGARGIIPIFSNHGHHSSKACVGSAFRPLKRRLSPE